MIYGKTNQGTSKENGRLTLVGAREKRCFPPRALRHHANQSLCFGGQCSMALDYLAQQSLKRLFQVSGTDRSKKEGMSVPKVRKVWFIAIAISDMLQLISTCGSETPLWLSNVAPSFASCLLKNRRYASRGHQPFNQGKRLLSQCRHVILQTLSSKSDT